MRHVFSFWVVILFSASCAGGPGGCGNMTPVPENGLPASQKLEGGVQFRITEEGFEKVRDLIAPLANGALGSGFCVGERGALGVDFCGTNQGSCTPGCSVDINVDSLDVQIISNSTLRISGQFDASTDIHADAGWVGSCTFDVSTSNVAVTADVNIGIDEPTGELRLSLGSIDIDNLNIGVNGCGFLGDVIGGIFNFVESLFGDTILDFVIDALTPVLSDIIVNMLPSPLGIEGVMPVGQSIAIAPHDTGLELSTVVGGYAEFNNEGVTVGAIVGFNSDADKTSRAPANSSQPSKCVPARSAPDLLAAPWSLPVSSRGSPALMVADRFSGVSDPVDTDFLMGISESSLDLLGHHLVSSGGLCLEFGTEQATQLNVGTLGVLLPSLAELGSKEGNDPLKMVLRPLSPIDFEIGDGTAQSPHLTATISDLDIDLYAYLFERYVRALTITISMDVGINLDFATDASGNLVIMPMLIGLDSSKIALKVGNAEFLREDASKLESTLPGLLDLILPSLGNALGSIALPEVAGFELSQMTVQRVVGAHDDFLAIEGMMSPGSPWQVASLTSPELADAMSKMSTPLPTTLGKVSTPTVLVDAGGQVATATVSTHDSHGRLLEWSWRMDGGLLHAYQSGSELVMHAPRLQFAGKHRVELIARIAQRPESAKVVASQTVTGANIHGIEQDQSGSLEAQSNAAHAATPSGCSGATGTGSLVLLAMVLLVWRRRVVLMAATLAVGISASCGSSPQCKISEDCAGQCGAGEIGTCFEGDCLCGDDVRPGRIGVDLSLSGGTGEGLWLATYNETHGDLMIAQNPGSGRVPFESWQYVDGVPDGPVIFPHSKVRGGIFEKGPDRGGHPSIAAVSGEEAFVSYFDADEQALRLGHFDGSSWKLETIVTPAQGEVVGFRSVADWRFDTKRLGIAYTRTTTTDEHVSHAILYRAALNPVPGPLDWIEFEVVTGIGTTVGEESVKEVDLAMARDNNGVPTIVYTDGTSLAYSTYNDAGGGFAPAKTITAAAALNPSIAFDDNGDFHVSFFDPATRALYYSKNGETPVLIDSGLRVDGQTSDGYDIPVFHAVGADSAITAYLGKVSIGYQDATSHEYMLATMDDQGVWSKSAIAGDEQPFAGGYGFFAGMFAAGGSLVFGNWVVDQPSRDDWVEVISYVVDVE